jgi:hypothetical protein
MSRQGRLTIHSCSKCRKQQIHLDVSREPATLPARREAEELDPIKIWRTTRKCRECGNLVFTTSPRWNREESRRVHHGG